METFVRQLTIRFRVSLATLLIGLSAVAILTITIDAQQSQDSTATDQRVDAMLAKLTLEQKIDLIGGVEGMFIQAMPEIGFPRLKMSDGPMGVRTWGTTTGYAAGIGLAASWDTELARRVGVALGQDARARGVNFLLGPGVNIYRAPMNGRNFEYFGEDPYLASRIAVHYIEGVQSQGVIATIKHYAANNSEFDRHRINSVVDERTLREIYLPAFEAGVKEARVGAVMDSYNLLNGDHATQNKFLNIDVLRNEWGFKGILMSDWGATYDAVAAANNGLDLEMPSGRFMNQKNLLPAIQAGTVSEATIDEKVRRILRTALEFNFLGRDQLDLGVPLYSQESRQVALQSAEESLVLLKNEDHLLPLDPHKIRSIAIIGPDAFPAVPSAGGSAEIDSFEPVSFMTGLSDALGTNTKVLWNRGLKDLKDVFGDSGVSAFFGGGGAKFFTDPEGQHPGLKQEEFGGGSISGGPTQTRTVPNINSWGGDQWAEPSRHKKAYRWTAYYIPKTSGSQRFIAAGVGRDAYKLFVDDKLVFEQEPHEGQVPQSRDVDLPAGKAVAVRFEYFPQTDKITCGLGVITPSDMVDPEATKIAAQADAVVLAVGFDPRTEGEAHDRTYSLPSGQDDLIKAVLAANHNTTVVITAGGSVDTSQWLNDAPAVLQAWYGGSEAGHALAQVLLGEVNPSGKLPISWERRLEDNPSYNYYYEVPGSKDDPYKEGIFVGYRAYDRGDTKPLFPFGFGLSYSTFDFSHLRVNPAQASADGPVTVSFDVRNTGKVAGAEVCQVYIGDPSASVPRPVKELKDFERVVLDTGGTQHVTITLNRRSLAYWDVKSKDWKVDPGTFKVFVGDSSANVPLQADFSAK
ncbi:MAG TPA: glycoside hydrolase family 3 C-terminal domain-containing protein [Terriglobia bacterium]